MARLWFDTEFIDDGERLVLLSIGVVRDDDATYYAEIDNAPIDNASPWVCANVLPQLTRFNFRPSSQPWREVVKTRETVAAELVAFAGDQPEWWAYCGDYDWVVLSQLYGPLVKRPAHWPYFCYDVRQAFDEAGMGEDPDLWVTQPPDEHYALADAHWTRDLWRKVDEHRRGAITAGT